ALSRANLPAARVHLPVDRIAFLKELLAPLDGREPTCLAALSVRIARPELIEDWPFPQREHLEHVARVVDVVHLAASLLPRSEEAVGIGPRRPEEHGHAAVAHDEAVAELLELVLRRLMDRHDDRLAGGLGEIVKERNQRSRVVGGETAR